MKKFYVYGDEGQLEIEADNFDSAANEYGIPTSEQIDNGAWLIVRDEETMEEKKWGRK